MRIQNRLVLILGAFSTVLALTACGTRHNYMAFHGTGYLDLDTPVTVQKPEIEIKKSISINMDRPDTSILGRVKEYVNPSR